MSPFRLGIYLIAIAATACSSDPPREIPPFEQTTSAQNLPALQSGDLAAFPISETAAPVFRESQQEYEVLSALPPAESRSLRFHLGSQTFDYFEDGQIFVSGPIASGKAGSRTPTGRFAVLSKDKDKESSLYTNEVGTPAWMPYSLQFYGNYFIHEGWLPGYPASHGCIRIGHHHAKLLFERMKIGDPVTVTN